MRVDETVLPSHDFYDSCFCFNPVSLLCIDHREDAEQVGILRLGARFQEFFEELRSFFCLPLVKVTSSNCRCPVTDMWKDSIRQQLQNREGIGVFALSGKNISFEP